MSSNQRLFDGSPDGTSRTSGSDTGPPRPTIIGSRTILPFVQGSDGVWRWSGHLDERPLLEPYEPSEDLAALIEHLAAETP